VLTPAAIDPDKVAVYIRWSTDDQGEGTTLQTQLERCQHYLQSQGWRFTPDLVYIDDGYSGGTLDRPALTRLRSDVDGGRVECVVVYKIDRLSRSVIDIVDLVLREWDGRCFVKSTTEEVNTLSPAGKMFFHILISFAEYERNLIRERTMGGKVKRAEQGLNPGFRPPYGFVRGAATGTFQVVADEASLVRRIFDLCRNGHGPYQIAHRLNSEGLRRRGAPWNPLMIRRMLLNPAYVGVLEYGRRSATGRLSRVEGAFPAIVPAPVWEEVQGALRDRSRTGGTAPRPTYSGYLLSGVAVCRCGAPVGGKRVGQHRYYYCTARKRRGRSACDSGHFRADQADDAVTAELLARLPAGALPGPDHGAGDVKAGLEQQRGDLRRLADRRRRLEQDYRSGELPASLYARELAAVEREEGQVAKTVQRLSERLARWETRAPPQRDPAALWEGLGVVEQKGLLRRLASRIELYRGEDGPVVRIEWLSLSDPSS